MTTKTSSGLKVNAAIKAGSMGPNHVRGGLKVRAGIKAGSNMQKNHNVTRLTVA